jgi:ABC-type multidrug transport system fused ATPase/permease subunit
VRPYRWPLAGAVAATLATSALTLLAAVVVGRAADAALADDSRLAVTLAVVGIVAAVALTATQGVSQALLARVGEYVVRDVRDGVVDSLLRAPLAFVERHRHGDLLQRSTTEIAALSTFVRESLPALFTAATTLAVAVVVLAVESWLLLLVLLATFLPGARWVARRFRAGAPAAFGAEASAEADVMAEVSETIRVREVLAAGGPAGRARAAGRLEAANDRAVAAQMRTVRLGYWINGIALVEGVSLAALIAVGAVLVDSGAVTVGVVVTFVLASRTVFAGLSDLTSLVSGLEEAAAGAARTRELLDVRPPVGAAGTQPAPARRRAPAGPLVIDAVTFGYVSGQPVLDGLCLTVPPGQRVGILGRTGAGKSTLAKLAAGLYTPAAGSVTCRGEPVRPGAGPRIVAFVPQQVQLGAGSVADELRLAGPHLSDAELHAAAARLRLDGWLDSLPDGLDTRLGGGSPLSAGERQLVGLVRVALLDSPVLVLDEATSDLDPRIAELVEGALDGLAGDRSVLVVAHRPESLAGADAVYRLSGGRLHPA